MKKFKSFIHSFKAICLVLVIVCIVLIIFNLYIMKETQIYSFGGYANDITISDGSIVTTLRINRFAAPSIAYNGEDVKMSEYEIGYYIGKQPISVISSKTNELTDVSLVELLKNSDFTFTENHKDANSFSHENLKKLDNLLFRIYAKTKSDKEISIEVPLEVTKIS